MNDKVILKKVLGQNFLKDSNIINKIVNSASIDGDTFVIEIGPGGGAITNRILSKAKFSLLYEIDGRLEDNLRKMLSNCNNYELIIDDFLKRDLKYDLGKYHYDKLYVVASLPYYITTPIIMKFIDENVLPDRFVIMMQKEVASRISASIGSKDYGSLTVFLDYYYDIKKLFDVSRNCFYPSPNVDSSVICMDLKKNRLVVSDIELFKRIVRDSFRLKRKTLRNNLKDYDLEIIERVLNGYGFDLNVRAEMLKLEVFVDITNGINLGRCDNEK